MAKKMIIKGVGSMMAKRLASDGGIEVLTLGTLQDLKITMNTEIDDIFGGDGLFAIDTLVKSKSIEISATDAKFDLAAVTLMMGSTVTDQTSSYVWVLNEQQTLGAGTNGTTNVAECAIEFGTTVYSEPDFAVRLKDTNKLLTKVAYAIDKAPGVVEYMYDATDKKLYLALANVGKDVVTAGGFSATPWTDGGSQDIETE